MAEESVQQGTDGSAKAAIALAQMVFWWLLQQGLLPKDQAVQMLKQAVKANKAGGEDHQLAATKLAAVLQSIQVYQPPARH